VPETVTKYAEQEVLNGSAAAGRSSDRRSARGEETTSSGIVLPDTAKEKPQRGKVLAVGPGMRNDSGEIVPMEVAVGDEIIYSKYGGTEIKLGADDVLILRESDVLAKVAPRAPRRARRRSSRARPPSHTTLREVLNGS
jgi:chaperonin GroES